MPQLQARGAGNVTGIKSFNGRNGIRKEINENDGGMDVWLSWVVLHSEAGGAKYKKTVVE